MRLATADRASSRARAATAWTIAAVGEQAQQVQAAVGEGGAEVCPGPAVDLEARPGPMLCLGADGRSIGQRCERRLMAAHPSSLATCSNQRTSGAGS